MAKKGPLAAGPTTKVALCDQSFVANHHSSLVDPVALIARLPRLPRFLAKSALWDTKFLPLRPFLWLAGAIPVHRTTDGGVFLYPVWWIALGAIAGYFGGPIVGIVALVAAPLAGYISARKAGRLRRLQNREALGDHHGLDPTKEWVKSTARTILAASSRTD